MARKIIVRDDSSSTYRLKNGKFICAHDRAVINPPCCNGVDCNCDGIYRVICKCNKEIEGEEMELILAHIQ